MPTFAPSRLAVVAALTAGFVTGPIDAASACTGYTQWWVKAYSITIRDSPGGRVLATMYGGRIVGPTGQGGNTWIYGRGWYGDTAYPVGYVLRQYLDYSYTHCN